MKKTLLLVVNLLVSMLMMAGSVTVEQAEQIARQFLTRQRAMAPHRLVVAEQQATTHRGGMVATPYYIFNVDSSDGYVIVSGDDRAPAVLGYSDQGTFSSEALPENMRAWLQGYADQLAWLSSHPDYKAKAPALDEHPAVQPLVTTLWNQGEPYNNLCPLDDGQRSVTGCAATAMAQVLNYHQYPAQTLTAIPGYTTTTRGISVSGMDVTTIDWFHMRDRYTGSEMDVENNAVATLMRLCGTAIRMDYSSGGSGAMSNDVPEALKTYFGYDAATKLINRGDYRAHEWNNLIYNELANNRPVFYCGQSTGGGHAFVIDGYDSDGFFHVNWGWGGSRDGYFLLSILDPESNSGIGASSSSDGYSFSQDAMIGAQPDTGFVPTLEVKMTTYNIFSVDQSVLEKQDDIFEVLFNVEMYNEMGAGYTFDIGVGVYSLDNELLYAENLGSVELDNYYGWNNAKIGADVPTLPDGKYIIVPISRETGTETWYQNNGSNRSFIIATVSGSTMTLQLPTIDLSGTLSVEGKLEVSCNLTVSATIQNNGTLFNDILYLQANGNDVGAQYFEVDEGQNDVLEMRYIPASSGSVTLALGYKTYYYDNGWYEEFHTVTSKKVYIQAAKSYSLSFSNGSVTNASGKVIADHTAHLQVDITNNGANDYVDDIQTLTWKKNNNDGYFYYVSQTFTPVSIAVGQTQTVNVDVENLENGEYWFMMVYKTNGEYISYNDADKRYDALYAYTVSTPAPIFTATFVNAARWEQVYAYTYGAELNGPWPGEQLEKTGTTTINGVEYDVYTYSLQAEEAPGYIVFNNGTGGDGNQTEDLVFRDGRQYGYRMPAVIDNVELRGQFNNWSSTEATTMTLGAGAVWTMTLDLTETTDDQEFKLFVNDGGNEADNWAGWMGTNMLTLDVPNGWVVPAADGDNSNLKLMNSLTTFKTYAVTATWTPSPVYYAGWTLKIAGLDDRYGTAISDVGRDATVRDRYYDLSGRQVAHPKRGLYIQNGRTAVVK